MTRLLVGPFFAAALALALLPGAARATLDSQGLPSVLSQPDEQRYREIFELQEAGKWQAADKLIKQLDDQRLMGHVLFQRYMHPTAYRSNYTELKRWMDHYADHPEAKRIYRLAVKRRPANYKAPKKPVTPRTTITSNFRPEIEPYRSTKQLSASQRRRARQLLRQVRRNVLGTRLTATENLLARGEAKRVLDQVQRDQSYAKVAAGWYYYGRPDKAFKLADGAAKRSGDQAPMTHWIAGLAAWRLGDLEAAARHFEGLAEATRASSWTASAGAYWAARSHLRLRQPEQMSKWLLTASAHQETFYGLLARRALGMETRFDFRPHEPTKAGLARIDGDPAGHRALGLIQVGQVELAEQELLRLKGWDHPEVMETLLGARRARQAAAPRLQAGKPAGRGQPHVDRRRPPGGRPLPDPAVATGQRLQGRPGPGLCPDAPGIGLQPQGQEPGRRARPDAAHAGDRQLHRRQALPGQAARPAVRSRPQPGAQPALSGLPADQYDSVEGDLFRLTTAYNGGPGNLAKWERKIKIEDDPLLFIESLPSRETRVFIERVLTNFWIYRARLGQPAPSLDAAASGTWPGYAALDGQSQEIARRVED